MKKVFYITSFILAVLPINSKAQRQQEKFRDMKFCGNILRSLSPRLNDEDRKNIDLDKAYYLEMENTNHYFLRIPFKERPINSDFIGLEMDSLGNCKKGSIVHRNKGKLPKFSEYADSFVIYSLNRAAKRVVFITPMKALSDSGATKEKVLDPAMLISNDQKLNLSVHLNMASILNPEKLELMEGGYGFGIAPAGETSGGFGTYSYYFDVDFTVLNYLPPVADKVESERP
ncbi:hypothetical protein BH11BAC5_BH11BAC5_43280 [soil metagenome]